MRKLLSFFNQTITRIRPGTMTERGTTYPDWSEDKVTTVNITNCCITWKATNMSTDGRVLGISDTKVLYAPLDADIKAGDRVKQGEETYEIEGTPEDWNSPTGALNHYEITLKRYEG